MWHYQKWSKISTTVQHENGGEDQQKGLFEEYVNTFLKIKAESSGFPQGVQTDEQRREFIEQYFHKEGIRLDPEAMHTPNPCLRQIVVC